MRAYLENKARKQREAMERKYGVGSLSGGGKLSSDGSYHAAPREASSVTLGVGAEVKRAAAIAVEANARARPSRPRCSRRGSDGMSTRRRLADSVVPAAPPGWRAAPLRSARARPPLSNRSSIKGVSKRARRGGNRWTREGPRRWLAAVAGRVRRQPPSTPRRRRRDTTGGGQTLQQHPGPVMMTPSATLYYPPPTSTPRRLSPRPHAPRLDHRPPLGLHALRCPEGWERETRRG